MSGPFPKERLDTPDVDERKQIIPAALFVGGLLAWFASGSEATGVSDATTARRQALETEDAPPEALAPALPMGTAQRPSDGDSGRSVATSPTLPRPPRKARRVTVRVVDRDGRCAPGIDLELEGCLGSGPWLRGPRRRTDELGEASLPVATGWSDIRVGARFPGAPEPVRVPHSGQLELIIDRPLLACVDLESVTGRRLTGAQRVALRVDGEGGGRAERHSLTATSTAGRWSLPLTAGCCGRLLVTDSLGGAWQAPIALEPGRVQVATPSTRWLTVARDVVASEPQRLGGSEDRLRWSLRVGDRAPRVGSGRQAPDRGFHAVLPRSSSRARGGLLELRWDEPGGEQVVACAWHPDAELTHLSITPSPIGGGAPLSTRNSTDR